MKILIVQLSDIHCNSCDFNYVERIDKASEALRSLGEFDGVVLTFCGDLTNSATKEEFSVGKLLLERFIKQVTNDLGCGDIPIVIVPGNHDMVLSDKSRGIEAILAWQKARELDKHLDNELSYLDNFFTYANSNNCFKSNRVCDITYIEIAGKKIRFRLLNSAPFSTRKKDNKQVHYFPPSIEDIYVDTNVDLKISIMHHSYEWFDFSSKKMLRKMLINDDIVFLGHDHDAEIITHIDSEGLDMRLVMGGEFQLKTENNCSFNAIIYDDTVENSLTTFEFNWNPNAKIFLNKERTNWIIKSSIPELVPTNDYLDSLLLDSQQISTRFTDYYVLPKLKPNRGSFSNLNGEQINENSIFQALDNNRIIEITGDSTAGKTALLKHLYSAAVNRGLIPLYIEKRDYTDSRIEKMIKDMFYLQYGESEYGYEFYTQSDRNKKVVFIDDFDLIDNLKARENLLEYICSRVGHLIFTTSKSINQDLATSVKEKLRGRKIDSMRITSFYKQSRDELLNEICKVSGNNKSGEFNAISGILDYMVQTQTHLLSLTPESLIQYIKYYLSGDYVKDRGVQSFNVIFETNIRNSLIKNTKDLDVTIYLSALEYLAYNMYFSLRTECIQIFQFEEICMGFNKKYRGNVIPKSFLSSCKAANILMELPESFCISFSNNNTLAYFVAKYINRELERDPSNVVDIHYVMNHICFGINGTIILFLSYIRNNTRIILDIAAKAIDLMEKYPELDFEENNLPMLKENKFKPNTLPTAKEIKEVVNDTENIEKIRHETVRFKGIFDYKDEDVEKEENRILRAHRYTQLIGQALLNQYGSLTGEEIDIFLKVIYSIPQKVIYARLKPYQDNYDEVINEIMRFATELPSDDNVNIEDIKNIFNSVALSFSLDVMNDIAFNCSNSNTINVLNDYEITTQNQSILNLMMEENAGNSQAFVNKSISKFNDVKEDAFIKILIGIIARKHIIFTKDFDYTLVDKLVSSGVLSSAGKKSLLFKKRRKKDEKIN